MAECSHRAPCPGGEYCVCLKCLHRGGLQKVHESKCGLCIYLNTEPEQVQDNKKITKFRPLPGSTSEFPAEAYNNNIVIIIYNTEDIEKKSADYLPEIDINEVSCPRCRYITTRAKALLETVPLIQKNELKSVCGLCSQKKQSSVSCIFCQRAIHNFLSDSQKKEDLANKLLSLINAKFLTQPDLNKEIKKLSVCSETDIRQSVGTNKYDHRSNRPKSGSNINPKAICKCDEKLACLLQKNLKGKKVTIQVKIESESSEKMISLREMLNQGKLYPEEEVIKGPLKPILKPCLETLQRTGLHSDTVIGIGTTGILRRSRSEETLLSFFKLTEEKYEKDFEYRFPGMKKREKDVIKKTSDELIKDTQHRLREEADIKLQEKEQSQQKKEERKRSEIGDFEEKTSREKGTKLEKEQRGKGKTEKGKEPQLRSKEGVAKKREISEKPVKVKQEKAERTAPEKVKAPTQPPQKEKVSEKGKVTFEPKPLPPEKQKKAPAEDAGKGKTSPKPSEKETKAATEAKPPLKKETKPPAKAKPPAKEEDAGKGKTPPKPSEKETIAFAEAKLPPKKETKLPAEAKPPVKEEHAGKGKTPPKPSEKETKPSAEGKLPVKEEHAGKGKTSPKPSEKDTKASAGAKPPPKKETKGPTEGIPSPTPAVKKEDVEKGKTLHKSSEKETKAFAEAKPPPKRPVKEEDAEKGKTSKPSEKETKASAKAKLPSKPPVKEETGKGKKSPEPPEKESKSVKEKKEPDVRKVEIPDKQIPTAKIGKGDMRKTEVEVLNEVVKKQEKVTETLKDKKVQGDKLAKDVEKTELAEEPKDKKDEARSRKESKKAESVKEEKGKKPKEVVHQDIEMLFSGDNLLANMVKMRDRSKPQRIPGPKAQVAPEYKVIRPRIRKKPSVRSLPSVLESDIIIQTEEPEMIVGEKIVLRKHIHIEVKEQSTPDLYYTKFMPDINDEQGRIMPEPKIEEKSGPSGHFLYALSDKRFINKGWTKLPTEKIVRKLNIYRMRPSHPELDWFARNKGNGDMFYDTGEKKADFSDDGYGRWYYKNGRIALDYYECEDGQNRFVVYSSGCQDERGRSQPITVLAMFDHSGNGIVFDHGGKIRLKYNQNEGVILDRTLGPVSHWLWHSLNDPPHLQHVMIDTQLKYKHPEIMKFDDFEKCSTPPDHEEINSIEHENFIKMKNNKTFRPYQINMKALKINHNFSLKVIDQQTIYLCYRDGSDTMKLNLGMALDNNEIVDSTLADIGEVELNIDKLPAMTKSIEDLQVILQNAQNISRVRQMERQLSKNRPIPVSSVDKLTAGISKARQSLKTINADVQCTCAHKIPFANNLYYNTGLI